MPVRISSPRRTLSTLLLVVAACDPGGGGGCGQVDFENGVDPTEDVPAELVEVRGLGSVWSSVWDNPPIMGLAQLEDFQSAEREAGSNEWTYAMFDLVATIQPPSANPAPSGLNPAEPRVLHTWPHVPGAFEDYRGGPMFWETHGMKLPPRVTKAETEGLVTAQALRTDVNVNNQYDPYTDYLPYEPPGRFQLDPDTYLVPLNVVVLYVPGDDVVGAARLPKRYLESVFDDYWTGTKDLETYAFGLWAMLGEWKHGCDEGCSPVSPMTQPDRVWDQCGIQFRAVQYRECPLPEELFWFDVPALGLQPSDACNLSLMDQLVQEEVAASCPDFDPDNGAPTVFLTGSVAFEDGPCVINGVQSFTVRGWVAPGDARAYIPVVGTSGLFLTHELGHVLGLDDVDCDPPNLMCSAGPTDDATPFCEAARARAALRQEAFWGG